MLTSEQMIATHPSPPLLDAEALRDCVEACYECVQACTTCADACLAEAGVADLTRCIRLDLDCADVCEVTGRLLSRQAHPDMELLRAQLQACIRACRVCAEECERHREHMDHCRMCAEACRRCEEACRRALASLEA